MADLITIAGSPARNSKSALLLDYVRGLAEQRGLRSASVLVGALPAEALLHGQADHPALQAAIRQIEQARLVVIATPVYKAAYTGALKALLDLLPERALAGKPVLPIATGGLLAHLLVLDYALKPVLAALGAQAVLQGVYVTDSQMRWTDVGLEFDDEIEQRLRDGLDTLAALR